MMEFDGSSRGIAVRRSEAISRRLRLAAFREENRLRAIRRREIHARWRSPRNGFLKRAEYRRQLHDVYNLRDSKYRAHIRPSLWN